MRRLIWLPMLLAAATAWGDPPGVSTSREGGRRLPLPKGEDVFHFVVYGDRTGGPPEGISILERAVRESNLLDPDLVMTVGDLVQGYNNQAPWMRQMREYRGVMDGLKMPWYPVAGNHDVYWRGGKAPPGQHEGNFEKHFAPLWYWFAHKNAAFVVLFSDEGDSRTNRKGWRDKAVNRFSDAQLAWLENALAGTKSLDHVFVFLHHPRWRTDYYPDSNWNRAHALLAKAGNVSAVFAGHMHRRRYHGKKDGIEYFTLAAVGGGMPFNVPGSGHLHHMDVVTVRKGGFQVATIPVGSVLDPKAVTAERHAEIDALRRMPLTLAGGPFVVTLDGAASGRFEVLLRNPTQRPLEATLQLLSPDPLWRLYPNHRHARIEPGAEQTLRFLFDRRPEDGVGALRIPQLDVQIDYLAAEMRVSLPERAVPFPLRLAGVTADFFAKRKNQALRLRGRDHLVLSDDRIPVPDGPLTIEGRIRGDAYKGRRAFLAKTDQCDYGIFVSDGQPSFSVFLGDAYVTAAGPRGMLRAKQWHHLAGVFDGAEVRLYVDGKLVKKVAGSGKRRKKPVPLMIGADPDRLERPMSFTPGLYDEIRLSKVARYAGTSFEPPLRHAPDEDTLLLLHCDGGVEFFVPDHSPGGRHILTGKRLPYVAAAPENAER